MTVTEVTTTPATRARHRAEDSTGLPPIRGQSFQQLVGLELRKSVNTRSGRVLLGALLLLALAALVWQLTHLEAGQVRFASFLAASSSGVLLLLPVLGVLAMTSEWTQRTALTTFTLSPRRIRVLLAKFLSAILLSVAAISVTALLALGATALAGAINGAGASYAELGGDVAGVYLSTALNVLMGAAFGALIPQTAIALMVYFIAPTAWTLGGPALLKENAEWLNVFGAMARITERELAGMVPEALTAITAWIVLPTLIGLWASSRREVK